MTVPIDVKIGTHNVTIGKFGAMEGWRVMHRLSSVIGPSMGSLFDDKYEDAIRLFFEKCDEDKMLEMMNTLLAVTLLDGRQVVFNEDMKDYSLCMEMCVEVVKHNFQEFFLTISKKVSGLLQKKPAKKARKKA